jgi:hypothetical protein
VLLNCINGIRLRRPAVLELAAMVEVVTRNALDAELASWAGPNIDWIDLVPLDRRGHADLAKAVARVTRGSRYPRTHGKVVAELNLGFWRYLTSQRYHASLWVPALQHAFPNGSGDVRRRRREVEQRLENLTIVRNRAAHHEPIHRRDLLRDYRNCVELLAWIDPSAAAWAGDICTLPTVVAAKP